MKKKLIVFCGFCYSKVGPFYLINLDSSGGTESEASTRWVIAPLNFDTYREDAEQSRGKGEVPTDVEEIEELKLYMVVVASSIATCNSGVELQCFEIRV